MLQRALHSRILVACVASVVTAIVVGGIAWSVQSPVDANGVIHGCYQPSTGNLRLNVSGKCSGKDNTPISWDQQGLHEIDYDTVPSLSCTDSSLTSCESLSVLTPYDGRVLDSAAFPPNATATVQEGAILPAFTKLCFQVFDVTTATPLTGTRTCATGPATGQAKVAMTTPSFQLDSGDHVYILEKGADGTASFASGTNEGIRIRW